MLLCFLSSSPTRGVVNHKDWIFPGGANSSYYDLQKTKCRLLFIYVYEIGRKSTLKKYMTREISRVMGKRSHLIL